MPFCKVALRAKKLVSAGYPKELKTLGNHLRKRRLELKMFQREVAAKLGTTPCTIQNWEKNHSNPFIQYMPKIIEFLGYVPFDMSCKTLGQEIATYRRIHGLRQKDLARLIGVDPSTIRSWEKGRHRPRKTLEKAGCFLHFSFSYNQRHPRPTFYGK